MTLSPRAVLCTALTLASLAGAGLVARTAAATPRVQAPTVENTYWPTADSEVRVQRVALRQETVADLMNGELTLGVAAERFWDISTGNDESLYNLRVTIPGGSDEEKVVNQLLMFARVHALKDQARYADRLARLETEATSFQLKPAVVQ